MKAKVSIIIPMYNSSNTIRKCLNSILKSYSTQIEIVVIDDCSSDNSLDIVKNEYKNIILVKNNQNMGPSFSRNKGISIANGDYVAFVDSDDIVSDCYCSKLLEFTRCNSDVCVFNFTNTEKIKEKFCGSKENKILFLIKYNLFGYSCNKLLRKQIIVENKVSFPISQNLCEDQMFYYDIFKCTDNIIFFDEKIYNYNRLDGSLSKTKRSVEEYDLIYKQKKDFFVETNILFTKEGFSHLSNYCISFLFLTNFDKNTMIYHDATFFKKYISPKRKIKCFLKEHNLIK